MGGSAGKVDGPRDLPDFRMWLLDQWRPGGEYARMAAFLRDIDPTVATGFDPRFSLLGLPRAALWWVSPEMSVLVDRASRTLPPTTLTDSLLPDDAGLVVFGEPLSGTAADTGAPMPIGAIEWVTGMMPDGPGIGITPYRFLPAGEPRPARFAAGPGPNVQTSELGGETVHVVMEPNATADWCPVGLTSWLAGSDTDTPYHDGADTEARVASTSEDRRWLAALWLLAAQPLAESTVRRAERAVARRSSRANLSSDVRLVNVRRRPDRDHEPGDGSNGGRTYSKRWIVEGFWRQQACGPGWSEHRPVFIESHVRGPKDKPLVVRETVKVLKGSDGL